MGTFTSDVLGTGLAHHAPTRQELLLARRIARRWKAWQPLLTHELRQRPHPPGHEAREMLRLERAHNRAMTSLVEQRVTWYRINHSRLDDPRWTDEERAYRIAHRRDAKPPKPKRPRGRPKGYRMPVPPTGPPPHPPELSCAEFVRLRSDAWEDEDASSA